MQPNYRSSTEKQSFGSQPASVLRQTQGYITLSPARKTRQKGKGQSGNPIQSNNSGRISLDSYTLNNPKQYQLKQNEEFQNIPLKCQQPFKKIPIFDTHDLIIRPAFNQALEDSRMSKKKKLSVTKLFQNVQLSSMSHEGRSQSKNWRKIKDFQER